MQGQLVIRESALDGFWIAIDHGQQNVGGTVGNTTALLPILEGAGIEAETVRKLLAAEVRALA